MASPRLYLVMTSGSRQRIRIQSSASKLDCGAFKQLGCLMVLDEGEQSPATHYCWSGSFQGGCSEFSLPAGATNQQFRISNSNLCFDDDLFSAAYRCHRLS